MLSAGKTVSSGMLMSHAFIPALSYSGAVLTGIGQIQYRMAMDAVANAGGAKLGEEVISTGFFTGSKGGLAPTEIIAVTGNGRPQKASSLFAQDAAFITTAKTRAVVLFETEKNRTGHVGEPAQLGNGDEGGRRESAARLGKRVEKMRDEIKNGRLVMAEEMMYLVIRSALAAGGRLSATEYYVEMAEAYLKASENDTASRLLCQAYDRLGEIDAAKRDSEADKFCIRAASLFYKYGANLQTDEWFGYLVDRTIKVPGMTKDKVLRDLGNKAENAVLKRDFMTAAACYNYLSFVEAGKSNPKPFFIGRLKLAEALAVDRTELHSRWTALYGEAEALLNDSGTGRRFLELARIEHVAANYLRIKQ